MRGAGAAVAPQIGSEAQQDATTNLEAAYLPPKIRVLQGLSPAEALLTGGVAPVPELSLRAASFIEHTVASFTNFGCRWPCNRGRHVLQLRVSSNISISIGRCACNCIRSRDMILKDFGREIRQARVLSRDHLGSKLPCRHIPEPRQPVQEFTRF
jgi:hypothetical protein